ncbi:hypothetical protein FLV_01865 [Flavobacterium pectinovorum]|nr:hypothetical protein [Flavobacterium pectinovorum]
MTNFWKQSGIPHKGWILIDVIDVREDEQSEDETEYESCMMCGNERIRYVHIVEHREINEEFRVGCVCAEKMTNDYLNPGRRESELRNRANRRKNWKKKTWKLSSKLNWYIKVEDHIIVIFKDKFTSKYKVMIDKTIGNKFFKDLEDAKMAAFNGIEYFKENKEW